MIALGDDNLTFIKTDGSPTFEQDLIVKLQVLAKFGVTPEFIFHKPSDKHKASFCSGYFFPCEKEGRCTHVYAPKCGRTLLKSGVSMRPD
jgi:hypothetical protein